MKHSTAILLESFNGLGPGSLESMIRKLKREPDRGKGREREGERERERDRQTDDGAKVL